MYCQRLVAHPAVSCRYRSLSCAPAPVQRLSPGARGRCRPSRQAPTVLTAAGCSSLNQRDPFGAAVAGLSLQLEVLAWRPDHAGYKHVFGKCCFTVSCVQERGKTPVTCVRLGDFRLRAGGWEADLTQVCCLKGLQLGCGGASSRPCQGEHPQLPPRARYAVPAGIDDG